MVTAAGILRVRQPKSAKRARIRSVFTDPEYRRQGLGRLVMTVAIDLARNWSGVDYLDHAVSENSPVAKRLHESLDFELLGREPEAMEYEGQRYDEIYMTLRL